MPGVKIVKIVDIMIKFCYFVRSRNYSFQILIIRAKQAVALPKGFPVFSVDIYKQLQLFVCFIIEIITQMTPCLSDGPGALFMARFTNP